LEKKINGDNKSLKSHEAEKRNKVDTISCNLWQSSVQTPVPDNFPAPSCVDKKISEMQPTPSEKRVGEARKPGFAQSESR